MIELLVLVALALANGVFAGAEIALLSVRATRVRELLEEGRFGARRMAELRADPERLLATVQIGITVIGATAGAFGGSSLSGPLAERLRPALGDSAEEVALLGVVGFVSYLSLVLGELVPKSLALRSAERYALLVAPLLSALGLATRPLIAVLTGSSNLVLRLFGDRTSFVEARLSQEELRQLVDEAATAGTVDRRVGDIAARALEFDALDVSDVLIPRPDMVCVPLTVTPHRLAELTRERGHSRLLVWGEDPDDLRGYVNVRDVLAAVVEGGEVAIADHLHPLSFVPNTMSATALLRHFQSRHRSVAVAVDETGTLRGLVTIEDLIEELVGDLLSEGERPSPGPTPDGEGRWLSPAGASIREVNRALGLDLPDGGPATTLGGLVLQAAERIPEVGEAFRIGGVELTVVAASRRKIEVLRLSVPREEGGAP